MDTPEGVPMRSACKQVLEGFSSKIFIDKKMSQNFSIIFCSAKKFEEYDIGLSTATEGSRTEVRYHNNSYKPVNHFKLGYNISCFKQEIERLMSQNLSRIFAKQKV